MIIPNLKKNMLLIESQVVRQLIRSKLFANEQSQVLWFLSPYVDAYIYIYNNIYIYILYICKLLIESHIS